MFVKCKLSLDKNLSVGHYTDKFFLECHTHEYYEFMYILQGAALNVANDEVQFLKSKSLTCIRPDDEHFIRKNGENDESLEFFIIQVPVEFMETQFEICPELREIICNPNMPVSISIKNTEFSILYAKILKLKEMELAENTDEKSRNRRKYLYFNLVREFCACMLEYKKIEHSRTPDWFSNLIVEIDEIPVEELAYEFMLKIAGVSPQQLWKTFQTFLNTSPVKYINERKMQVAYDKVVGSKDLLTDIAFSVGYNNYTHFSREFKKKFNCTPSELRKN